MSIEPGVLGQTPRYEIRLKSRAIRDLNRLQSSDFRRIDEHVAALARNPRPASVVRLRDWDKAYRIRIGPWRVIYIIDDSKQVVVVFRVLRREKDTYRQR